MEHSARAVSRGHHFVGDADRPLRSGCLEHATRKLGGGRDTAARTEHRLHHHRSQIIAVVFDECLRSGQIVVPGEHEIVRRIPRSRAVGEIQHAAVVPTFEDQNFRASGCLDGGGDRHQVGFGARIGEANPVEAEPATHQPGQLGFGGVHAADTHVLLERLGDSVDHAVLTVAQQAGGVVAEQVDIGVPVDVGERGALSRDEHQRKRWVGENGACVAAGEMARRLVEVTPATRVAVGEVLACSVDGHVPTLE